MRKILFQAKKLKLDEFDEGGWAIGLPREVDFGKLAIDSFCNGIYEVYRETLCQYIGLKDSKGAKIFENDLIKLTPNSDVIYRVIYDLDGAQFVLNRLEEEDKTSDTKIPICRELLSGLVVVGNVFDVI